MGFFGALLLVLILLFPVIIFASWYIPFKIQDKKINKFKEENPDSVRLQVLSKSSGSDYQITIHTIKSQKPWLIIGQYIYLALGDYQIHATFQTLSEYEKHAPTVGALLGGVVGATIALTAHRKRSKAEKSIPSTYVTVDLTTKPRTTYELKADPSNNVLLVVSTQGDKHEIKTYGYCIPV